MLFSSVSPLSQHFGLGEAVSKQFGLQLHNKKRGRQELLPVALQLLLITRALASISPTVLLKG